MISMTMEMKKVFFDTKAIKNAVDKETRQAISKSLAFVRRRQRSSLRRRKRPSRPGQTPSVHSRDPVATLKNILFAYDASTQSGVVGMVKLNSRRSEVASSMELPELFEFGGTLRLNEVSRDGKAWYQSRRTSRILPSHWKKRQRLVRIAPRPSAGPALEAEAEAGNILSPWANVVGG